MVTIAVFDSGIGSLSIIRAIQKYIKCDLIYFADEKNFPYGQKSRKTLQKIITKTIEKLDDTFHPDFIIIGSNTPTVLFPELLSNSILGIFPPISLAQKLSTTNSIAIMTTKLLYGSNMLDNLIQKNKKQNYNIIKINCSTLIALVENGKFLTDQLFTQKKIHATLAKTFESNKIDVATLSSTHLPFLTNLLQIEFPNVTFVDPADDFASNLSRKIRHQNTNSIKIFTSSDPKLFAKKLQKLGIKQNVNSF